MQLLGTFEAAKLLGISHATVRRWIDSGSIRSSRTMGGHRRIDAEDLRNYAFKHGLHFKDGLTSIEKDRGKAQDENGGISEEAFHVIAVDDSHTIISWLRRLFASKFPEIKFFGTESSFEALKLIEHVTPELVILDLVMPKLDGVELLQILKRKWGDRASDVRVIAITGFSEKSEMINRFLLEGGERVFLKPLKTKELEKYVASILPRARGSRKRSTESKPASKYELVTA